MQHINRELASAFIASKQEHQTLTCFKVERWRVGYQLYEVGEWGLIRDYCDYFARLDFKIVCELRYYGAGNNLFVLNKNTDKKWMEISTKLEVILLVGRASLAR